VLDLPELRVPTGARLFLHGPSGSGKTTLLGLVAGVLRADAGQVRVLGEELRGLSASRRDALRGARMGYIFQSFNLIPYLTARENILLPLRMNRARAARIDGDLLGEVRQMAARLGIEELLDVRPGGLSVGEQQRVAAARALVGRPDLVIADEPTSALDADLRDRFLDLLFDAVEAGGATLLFVSHDRALEPRFSEALSLLELNRVTPRRRRLES